MGPQYSIIKNHLLDFRESREVFARRRRPRRMSEHSTLLRVSPNAVAASYTIDILHRHAMTLVLDARERRGRVPLGVVAGAD
jgi:hypothetical protein